MIIFRVKINVAIYIEPRNGVKIFKKLVLGMSIFTQNLTWPPLRRKQNILKYRVNCIQKNRLCNTVSMSEANCIAQGRDARASAPDHRVKPEESCADCNSSIQEEIMSMLTNMIIPEFLPPAVCGQTTGSTPVRGHSSTSTVSGRANRTEMRPGRPRQDEAGNGGADADASVCDIQDAHC